MLVNNRFAVKRVCVCVCYVDFYFLLLKEIVITGNPLGGAFHVLSVSSFNFQVSDYFLLQVLRYFYRICEANPLTPKVPQTYAFSTGSAKQIL